MSNMEPEDTQFGRAAADKAEEADRMEREGRDPADEPEGSAPRAGGKAAGPDEESRESFPASDPPADY